MNKLICTLITASVLTGAVAYAQANHTSQNKKQSKSQTISDKQMDSVTAGQTDTSSSAAGSIAANNSSVTTSNTGTVDISGATLSGAAGINIVNSADSAVGNGVNVYNGSLTTEAANDGANVSQENDIDQSISTSASLDGYHRGANSQLTVVKSSDRSEEHTSELQSP